MKKIAILLTAMSLLITSVFFITPHNMQSVDAAVKIEVLGSLDAKVTASYLNVRQGPSQNYKVICVLKKGQNVKVFAKMGEWYALYDPVTGCVGMSHGEYMDIDWPKTTQTPTQTPQQTTPTPTPTPTPETTPKETTPTPTPTPTPETDTELKISADEQALLDLVNKARAEAGVGPLKFDAELMKVARLKAKDMVEKGYFSHESPTYGSPFDMMKQFGINFRTAGENIAGNRTVEGAFKAWMNSSGHKQNILNSKFNYTGIGIVDSPTYGKILVQMFIGK